MQTDISLSLKARVALEASGFRFSHSLGQNFIFDEELLSEIARLSGADEGINVLEIGPGAGLLTAELAKRGANVLAIELDRKLEPVLKQTLVGFQNVRIVFDDALKADIDTLTRAYFAGAPYIVAANLPYYISAEFILKTLSLKNPPRSLTLMLQSEAAQRVLARTGSENWCALAAITSLYCEGERVLDVPRTAFTPPPHVDSALVRLTRRVQLSVKDDDAREFTEFIKAAFAMRRKTLANNLASAYACPREAAERAISACGLDTRIRGEKLTLDQLSQVFYTLKENDEGQNAE